MAVSRCEAVRRVIVFQGPDRLPVNGQRSAEVSDVEHARWNQILSWGASDRAHRQMRGPCVRVRSEVDNMG